MDLTTVLKPLFDKWQAVHKQPPLKENEEIVNSYQWIQFTDELEQCCNARINTIAQQIEDYREPIRCMFDVRLSEKKLTQKVQTFVDQHLSNYC